MNDAQRRAICHGDGPARVLAGPGSGKTFVIVQRLRYLLTKRHIEPSSILVITFTKAAAEEMQERFCKVMDDKACPVHFGTFHAIFYYILKQSNSEFSKNILSESDKINLIRKLKIPFEKEFPGISLPADNDLLKQIGKYKNVGENYASVQDGKGNFMEEIPFKWIYMSYNELLYREEKLDFDDMAKQCLELFKKKPEILKFWQEYFGYILIDEFQDINEPQYEVVKCLAGERRNLFVVGDDDQSIYGFRGSNPAIMKRFVIDYPECECILLNQNFRSRKEIVDAAGKCIAENKERVEKQIIAARLEGVKITESHLVIKSFAKKAEEQEMIVARLVHCKEKEQAYEEAAIICRTNFELEETAFLLEKAGIPFQRREKKKSIFEHPIMKDFETYLRIAGGECDRTLLLQIINHPVRYIGRTFFTKEKMGLEDLKDACKNNPDKYFKIVKLEEDCKR